MKKEQPETQEASLTLGQLLVNRRKKAKLSTKDIANMLYLSVNYIEHIESDEFDALRQSPVFVRGYVRAYAKHVNLAEADYQHLLEAWCREHEDDGDPSVSSYTTRVPKKLPKWSKTLLSSTVAIFLLAAVFIWLHSHMKSATVQTPKPAKQPVTTVVIKQITNKAPAKQQQSNPPNKLQGSLHMDMDNN